MEITKEIRTNYCPKADVTYIMEERHENGELLSMECVGFYHGTPNTENTIEYYGKLKADYE